jgi:hypothetical protein
VKLPHLQPAEPCPCDSGRSVGRCCAWHGKVEPRPHLPPHRTTRTGVSRHGCYAGVLNDCAGPMSGEHAISASVLRKLDRGNGVFVQNFPWQKPGGQMLPVTALASNILCKQHNSDLSGVDDVAGRLFDRIERMNAEYSAEPPVSTTWLWAANGGDVERWLLKTLCGVLVSKSARSKDGDPIAPAVPDEWVRILYGRSFFAEHCGLYVNGRIGRQFKFEPRTVSFAPLSRNGAVGGLLAEVSGFRFALIMDASSYRHDEEIHRPRYVNVANSASNKTLFFHWDGSGEQSGIEFTWG